MTTGCLRLVTIPIVFRYHQRLRDDTKSFKNSSNTKTWYIIPVSFWFQITFTVILTIIGENVAIDTFWGFELCEMPIWSGFFPLISWHVPNFQICEAIFLKSGIDLVTMFSLKGAQYPRLPFADKFAKFDVLVFEEVLKKKRNFWVFVMFDTLYFTTKTEYNVHGFVNCTNTL